MSNAARARGFTLLEAVVAMAIVGIAGVTLLSWLNANLIAASRIREANDRALLTLNALELVANVNPAEQREGQARVPPITVRWRTRPLGEMRAGSGPAGFSLHRLGLFEMDVEAHDDSGPAASFTIRRLGYELVR